MYESWLKTRDAKKRKKPNRLKVLFSTIMSEEEILVVLRVMEADPQCKTEAAYRANSDVWPENSISFSSNHLQYLKTHPNLNPRHYLANLKLMIKIR